MADLGPLGTTKQLASQETFAHHRPALDQERSPVPRNLGLLREEDVYQVC